MSGIDDVSVRIAEFVAELAEADTMNDVQHRYLDGVRGFVRGFGTGIYVLDPATRRVRAMEAGGVSDFFLSQYEEVGRMVDPVLRVAVETSHAVDSGQLMSLEAWPSSELYRRVLHLHRMHHLLQAPVIGGGQVVGTLNFGRHADEGPFTGKDRAVADLLGRLLGVVVTSLDSRASASEERDRALATLDLVAEAVVVSDLEAGDRWLNAAARALLRRLPHAGRRLHEVVAYPDTGDVAEAELAVTLDDGGAGRLSARTTVLPNLPAVLVTFLALSTGERSESVARALALPGMLTARERDVALLAADGLRDREIAARLFLSPHTVKQHLKSAYRKLGVRSRVDLARVMAGPHPPPPPSEG